MSLAVGLVAHPARIVAGVAVSGPLRVQRLVGRLWVQDQVGHTCRPRVRDAIFEPGEERHVIKLN